MIFLILFLFHVYVVALQVLCELCEGGRPDIVLEDDAVFVVLAEVALRLKLVDPVESVIAPALIDFKLGRVYTVNHLRWPLLVDELNTVLVWLRSCWRVRRRSLVHLQEDRDVGALRLGAITIGVDLQTPGDSVSQEGRRVDWLLLMSALREVLQLELSTSILRDDLTGELQVD